MIFLPHSVPNLLHPVRLGIPGDHGTNDRPAAVTRLERPHESIDKE